MPLGERPARTLLQGFAISLPVWTHSLFDRDIPFAYGRFAPTAVGRDHFLGGAGLLSQYKSCARMTANLDVRFHPRVRMYTLQQSYLPTSYQGRLMV
jgi:hypothetical protein